MYKLYVYGLFIISIIFSVLIPIIKGNTGELIIKLKLAQLPKYRYKVLNNIMLKTKNGTTQIDHIVVSEYGIFVIETKNYTGLITGNTNTLEWTKNMFGKKFKFRNPILQNKGHIIALSRALNINKDKFIPIVVFVNDCKLRITTKSTVIYDKKLLKTISNYKTERIDEQDVNRIASNINKLNQKGILMKIKHIMYVKERQRKNKNRKSFSI